MSKHTSEPWVVTDTRNARHYPGIRREVVDEKGSVIDCQQVYPFYACAPEDRDFARHLADKRLIEAAPDMLQALYDCITQEGAHCVSSESVDKLLRRLKEIDKIARIAITKATGE